MKYWEMAAITALLSGNVTAYDEFCRTYEEKVRQPEFAELAWSAGRVCSLLPDAIEDHAQLAQQVRSISAKYRRQWWKKLAEVAINYRAGNLTEAERILPSVMRLAKSWQDQASTKLWQALIQIDKNDSLEAQESFNTVLRLIEENQQPPGIKMRGVLTQAELIVLKREVELRLVAIEEAPPNTEDKSPSIQEPFNRPSAISQERERFLGKWTVQEAVMNGKPVEAKLLDKAFVKFTDKEMTFALTPDAVGQENTFPYELDLTLNPHGINTLHSHEDRGNTRIMGIYQFQGEQLKIAFAPSIGDPRPGGFAAQNGDGGEKAIAKNWVTLVLTRERVKNPER